MSGGDQKPPAMPEQKPVAPATAATSAAPEASVTAKAAAEGNPVFRMMGLPNLKAKLPSRNWLIFLTVTGSFAAAVYYDKRETKRIQKKYCDLVAPLTEKHLPTNALARKMTVYLQAPPADGLRSAREHFYDYVKPVLVAGGMDWDVVEGRREGDLRFGCAERIRRVRRRNGEGGGLSEEEMEDKDEAVRELRQRVGTVEEEGEKGDLVVGRHAWKEYLRGVHEGWLGPVREPVPLVEAEEIKEETRHVDGLPSVGDAAVKAAADIVSPTTTIHDSTSNDPSTTTTETTPEPAKTEEPAEQKPKSKSKPAPYIPTTDYASSSLPSSTPQTLGPATVLPFPHILGFWNFPIRIYRFLNRRQLAEETGRLTAAAVLAHHREWRTSDVDAYEHEEKEWHKSVRKQEVEQGKERLWMDEVVLDQRIEEKLRIFELPDARQ